MQRNVGIDTSLNGAHREERKCADSCNSVCAERRHKNDVSKLLCDVRTSLGGRVEDEGIFCVVAAWKM